MTHNFFTKDKKERGHGHDVCGLPQMRIVLNFTKIHCNSKKKKKLFFFPQSQNLNLLFSAKISLLIASFHKSFFFLLGKNTQTFGKQINDGSTKIKMTDDIFIEVEKEEKAYVHCLFIHQLIISFDGIIVKNQKIQKRENFGGALQNSNSATLRIKSKPIFIFTRNFAIWY